jgi:uncharacterized membrane protein
MRWFMGVLLGVLALIGIGASISHYFVESYNPGFRAFPLITAFHVILGGVYLALAPFQFVGRIRSRWLRYHRWAGRVLVAIGLIVGLTALFMGLVIPFSGWSESVVITAFGGWFLIALVKGFRHIRAGQVELHRAWMIRAFAIGLSIATMRLIFIPTLMLAVNPTDEQIAFFSVASFTIAFILHASVAEWWIRRTPQRTRRVGQVGQATSRW